VLPCAGSGDPACDGEFALLGDALGLFSGIYFLPSFVGGFGILGRRPWALVAIIILGVIVVSICSEM
jgi:hypothetical protein